MSPPKKLAQRTPPLPSPSDPQPSTLIAQPSPSPLRIETDVACTVCGCVCDDLSLHFQGGQIVRVERACVLAEPWFAALAQAAPPAAFLGMQVATHEQAITAAVEILSHSQAPLIYGLSRSSTPGQRAAVELA